MPFDVKDSNIGILSPSYGKDTSPKHVFHMGYDLLQDFDEWTKVRDAMCRATVLVFDMESAPSVRLMRKRLSQ